MKATRPDSNYAPASSGSDTSDHNLDHNSTQALVDDNERFLDVAREALERDGIEVVGVASSIADAMARVAELRADVTLVDISLGEESGFDLVERMADAGWADRCIIILISTYAESDFAEMIEASVARAFLPKTELSGGAIREIVRKFGRGARDRR